MNITTHFSTAPVCSWYLGTAWVEVDELILPSALLPYDLGLTVALIAMT